MNKKISQLLIRKSSQGIPWWSSGLGQCTFLLLGVWFSPWLGNCFHKMWCGKKKSSLLVVIFFYVLFTITDDDILIISCGGGTLTSLFILVSIYSCCSFSFIKKSGETSNSCQNSSMFVNLIT